MSENPRKSEMWVDPINGGFYYHVIDFKIPCRASTLVLERYYNSINENSNNAPWDKWVFSYDERLRFNEPYSDSSITVVYPNSYEDRFEKNPDGSFRPTTSKNRRSLCRNQDNTYTLSFPDGSRHTFRFGDGRLLRKEDVHGNAFTFEWTPLLTYPVLTVTPWDIRSITDPSGRKMEISYGNLGTERSLEFRWQGVRIITYIFSFPHGNLKRVIDAEDNQVSYEYGSETPWTFEFPGLKKITLPNGVWVENFSAGSRPLSVLVGRQVFGNGREIRYTYDRKNRVTNIQDQDRTVVYRYDAGWNITDVTNQEGYVTRYEYGTEGYVSRIIDARLGVWSYTHDSRGNVTAITNPLGASTQYEYHPTFDKLVRIIGPAPESRTNVISLHPATGDVLSTTAPLGGTLTAEYDEHGQITEVRHPNGYAESYSYDSCGNLTSRTDSMARRYSYTYDPVSRPVSATGPLGCTQYEWWGHGMIKKITDPLGNASSFEHDGCGNLTKVTDPLGNATLLQYDRMNSLTRIIDALGETLAFEYNLFVEKTRIITPRGHAYSYEYDRLSRVQRIEAPDGTSTSFSYAESCGDTTITDPRGNRRRILRDLLCRITRTIPDLEEPSTFFSFEYNAYDELTRIQTPMGRGTTIAYNGNGKPVTITNAQGDAIRLSYDVNDNIVSLVDPRGNETLFTRDEAGRLTALTEPEGGRSEFLYDDADNLVGTRDPLGNLWEADYDAAGRLTGVASPLGPSTALTLDGAGNVVSVTDALGKVSRFAYDAVDRLVSFTDPLGNTTALTFDPNGNLVTVTNPLENSTRFNYDVLDRLISTVDPESAVVRYTYDPAGNLSALVDPRGNTTAYTHDRRDRVTAEIFPDGSRSEATYDADDNLLQVKTPRSENISFEYDSANRVRKITFPDLGAVTYDFDRNGNRTKMQDVTGETSYSFDRNNRMIAKVNPDGKQRRRRGRESRPFERHVRADDLRCGGKDLEPPAPGLLRLPSRTCPGADL